MLTAETGSAIWLILATYWELPVSSTHAIGEPAVVMLLMLCELDYLDISLVTKM